MCATGCASSSTAPCRANPEPHAGKPARSGRDSAAVQTPGRMVKPCEGVSNDAHTGAIFMKKALIAAVAALSAAAWTASPALAQHHHGGDGDGDRGGHHQD